MMVVLVVLVVVMVVLMMVVGNSNEGGKKGRFKHAANSLPAYKILPWPQFIRQAPQDGPQALLHFRIAYAQAEEAKK